LKAQVNGRKKKNLVLQQKVTTVGVISASKSTKHEAKNLRKHIKLCESGLLYWLEIWGREITDDFQA
jgi:hypothetical protein